MLIFFFFQAEDGIRDIGVTGVQTCALPISRKALGGVGWPAAFSSLVSRNRRRYGGYVVHAAVVLLAIGVAGSSAYQTVREARLQPGGSMTVAGDRLVFRGFQTRTEGNHRAIRALV